MQNSGIKRVMTTVSDSVSHVHSTFSAWVNTVEVYFNVNYLSSAGGVVVRRAEYGKRGNNTKNCTNRGSARLLSDKPRCKIGREKQQKKRVYYPVKRPRSACYASCIRSGLLFPDSGATLLQFPLSTSLSNSTMQLRVELWDIRTAGALF